MIHHPRMGTVVKKVLVSFPSLLLAATIQPITRTVLRVRLIITPDFEWDDRIHGSSSEPWWLWVEDADSNSMYHSEYFFLQKKQVSYSDVSINPYTHVHTPVLCISFIRSHAYVCPYIMYNHPYIHIYSPAHTCVHAHNIHIHPYNHTPIHTCIH